MSVSDYKLGKLPYRDDPRTLRLASYITRPLPEAPISWGMLGVTDWPMYANDRLGDCTCAAAAHMVEVWTAASRHEVEVLEKSVVSMYEAITGGQDTGAVELDVLRYWRKHGLEGHRPYAYALVDPHTFEDVKLAASLFGGVYLGIALPKSAQAQTGPGKTWAFDGTEDGLPGTWGGHAVNVVAYDPDVITVVTWGQTQRMTWDFWRAYVDECWAILPADWQHTPPHIEGFNFQHLEEDLARVGKETA